MKILITLLFAGLLSGCAMFADEITRSASAVGKGVALYCENMPDSERPAFKADAEAACDEETGKTGCALELTCPQ